MLRIRLLVLLFLSPWSLAAKIDTVSAGDREIIRIRPGVMVRATELWTMGNSSFDSDVGLRLGVEYERLFPGHAVSWGLLFESAFESFSTAKATLFQPEVIAEVNYQAIDLNVGIRCYLASGDGSRNALSVGTIIDHTDVKPGNEGKGFGKKMVTKSVEFAREKGIKIIPLCPFAKSVFDKTPEFRDVL